MSRIVRESTCELIAKALHLAEEHNRISTSLLQRRLRIGYPRAARLMDQLEAQGIVGPAEAAGQSRQVLATVPRGGGASDEDE